MSALQGVTHHHNLAHDPPLDQGAVEADEPATNDGHKRVAIDVHQATESQLIRALGSSRRTLKGAPLYGELCPIIDMDLQGDSSVCMRAG
jgi:hypothetical protein